MKRHSFDNLRSQIRSKAGADEEIDSHKRAMGDTMRLSELRDAKHTHHDDSTTESSLTDAAATRRRLLDALLAAALTPA